MYNYYIDKSKKALEKKNEKEMSNKEQNLNRRKSKQPINIINQPINRKNECISV